MIGNFFNSEDGVPETRRFKTGMDALDERLDSGLRPGQIAEFYGKVTPSCEILFALDNSGSMEDHAVEVVKLFNDFLREQKAHAQPDALMSLALFNEDFQVVMEVQPVAGFRRLLPDDFDTDGNTALVDALGETITSGMARHAQAGRPDRTLVVLLTDGKENASRKYKIPMVRSMVERARRYFEWEFVLIGVGVKTDEIAHELGILPHLALSVAKGKAALRSAFKAASVASREALRGEEIRLLPGGKP
jgi:Mg-chelatase subunit ChlD